MKSIIYSFLVLAFCAPNAIAATPENPHQKLLAKVLKFHIKTADCELKHEELDSEYAMDLGNNYTVVMVSCGSGAYQGVYEIYNSYSIGDQAEIWPVSFVHTNDGEKFFAERGLFSVEFFPKTKSISAFYKARGMGDCGSTSVHKWDGTSFYLVESAYQPCCQRRGEAEDNSECAKFAKLKQKYPDEDSQFPVIYRYQGKKPSFE